MGWYLPVHTLPCTDSADVPTSIRLSARISGVPFICRILQAPPAHCLFCRGPCSDLIRRNRRWYLAPRVIQRSADVPLDPANANASVESSQTNQPAARPKSPLHRQILVRLDSCPGQNWCRLPVLGLAISSPLFAQHIIPLLPADSMVAPLVDEDFLCGA